MPLCAFMISPITRPACLGSETPRRAMVSRTTARTSSSPADLGQEARAERDLEVELGQRVGAPLADRGVLLARLAELLLVGGDHVQPEVVVQRPLEAGRRAALHVLGLDHADAVGGAGILGPHGILQQVGQLDLDGHTFDPRLKMATSQRCL